jgi:hypothetical protein
MGELRKHRNKGKRSSVHIYCTCGERGIGKRGRVDSTSPFSIPVHQNIILPIKDDAMPFFLHYLVGGCVLCKVLLRTKCLFSRKGQHANVFLGLKRTMLFLKTMCTLYTAQYCTLQIGRIGQMFVLKCTHNVHKIQAVLRIRYILVRIRIRTSDQRIRILVIISSVTFKMTTKFFFFFLSFLLITFQFLKLHLHHFSKIKSHKEITKE